MTVSPAKMAELICRLVVESGGPRNHVLGGSPDPHTGKGNLGGHPWACTDLPAVDFLALFTRGQE